MRAKGRREGDPYDTILDASIQAQCNVLSSDPDCFWRCFGDGIAVRRLRLGWPGSVDGFQPFP
jgi:hypothetical protein